MSDDLRHSQVASSRESALRRWLVILGVWSLAGLVAATQAYLRIYGTSSARSFVHSVRTEMPFWWIWAFLTPACLSVAARFPCTTRNWKRRVPLHLMVGVGFVLLYMVLQSPFALLREGRAGSLAAYPSAVLGSFVFQFPTHIMVYFALLGIGQTIESRRLLRERDAHASRLEAALASTRLEALRAQLQPHFLFNTLHTIGGFVRAGERTEAVRTLTGLSDLLRYTLDRIDAPEIPLHEEVEAAERYIQIEEARFRDRLEVTRDIDPGVIDALVPALIFQPLLENAMKHGVLSDQPRSCISMGARQDGDHLELWVEDDGPGLPEDFEVDRDTGIGLRLTRDRLDELYAGAHEFRVEAREPRGTRAAVRIPLKRS